MNYWDNYPNSKHIDVVVKSLNDHLGIWKEMIVAVDFNLWNTADDVMYKLNKELYIKYLGTPACRLLAWSAAPVLRIRLRGVIITLAAYDDCAHLLYSDPKEVKLLAALGSIPAIMLLTGSAVFDKAGIKLIQ